MINILTTSLYYYSPEIDMLKNLIGVLVFIGIVAYCCKSLDGPPERNNSVRTNQNKNLNNLHGYYGDIDENGFPENWSYDPTWDDAYFEKTGKEPWYDDNPWDHKK